MDKVEGIRSVDFKITALGHGVVNWNGPTTLSRPDGTTVDNHTLPKLRGYSNLTGEIKEETGYKYKKEPQDIDFHKNPLYVSQNCIRHHLFREHAFDLHYATADNIRDVLCSLTGLVRGYVVPNCQFKRTSALLLEDFVDQLGNGNFEQFGRAGYRDSSSFFSKTTFGDTKYLSYGSISVEQLQFISLDAKFDRAALTISEGEGEELASRLQQYIASLIPGRHAKASFHRNFVRRGSIFNQGEMGILLDNEAVDILVNCTVEKLKSLSIRQGKGYLYVDEVQLDFNDSSRMMRIKTDDSAISERTALKNYAVYFEAR